MRREALVGSAVLDSGETSQGVCISDAVLESTKTEDIANWLLRLHLDLQRQARKGLWLCSRNLPAVLVMDFSWALIYGCLKSFVSSTFEHYMQCQYVRRSTSDGFESASGQTGDAWAGVRQTSWQRDILWGCSDELAESN
jgi:hypothetical protein